MSVKTFGSEVLTSGDVNTYLANSGLVYVTSVNVGSGVSSVTVSSAFNSSYDNYVVQYTGGTGSANVELAVRLGSAVTNYKWNLMYNTYVSSTVLGIVSSAGTGWQYGGRSNTTGSNLSVNIYAPYLARPTYISAQYSAEDAGGTFQGVQTDSTSFTSVIVYPQIGTMTGGTITVYGYRKA